MRAGTTSIQHSAWHIFFVKETKKKGERLPGCIDYTPGRDWVPYKSLASHCEEQARAAADQD